MALSRSFVVPGIFIASMIRLHGILGVFGISLISTYANAFLSSSSSISCLMASSLFGDEYLGSAFSRNSVRNMFL